MFPRSRGLPVIHSAVMLACGCSGNYVWAEQTVNPSFDHTSIRSVAVIEFDNRTRDREAGRDAADAAEELLANESGYRVLSRMDLDWILEEHDLVAKGPVDPATVRRLASISGADALVMGTVDTCEVEDVRIRPLKVSRSAAVDLRIKLVDASSAQVVWSRRASGRFHWRGWKDSGSVVSRSECLQRALAEAVAEMRQVFPHKRRVRIPAGRDAKRDGCLRSPRAQGQYESSPCSARAEGE